MTSLSQQRISFMAARKPHPSQSTLTYSATLNAVRLVPAATCKQSISRNNGNQFPPQQRGNGGRFSPLAATQSARHAFSPRCPQPGLTDVSLLSWGMSEGSALRADTSSGDGNDSGSGTVGAPTDGVQVSDHPSVKALSRSAIEERPEYSGNIVKSLDGPDSISTSLSCQLEQQVVRPYGCPPIFPERLAGVFLRSEAIQ